jgi:integrase
VTPVERFARDYFVIAGLTPARQRLVTRLIGELEAHAGRPAHDCDAEHFRAFLAEQLDNGLHVNTVRKNAGALRPFFKWAWREGLIDGDRYMRLSDVENPRGSTGHSTPRPYKRKDLERFWRELDERWPLDGEAKWTRRWLAGRSPYRRVWPIATHLQLQAIVRLALDCGMRRTEILTAQLDDLHPDNAYVVVRGAAKGAGSREPRIREVPYTTAGREAVARWLAMRAHVMGSFDTEHDSPWLALHPAASPNNPLYPSSPGAPITRRAFGDLLGTVGGWELHRFRHTCATERLRAGMELEQLQRFLGHSRIQQTLAYAEIVRDDVQRAALRTEPEFERAVGRAA